MGMIKDGTISGVLPNNKAFSVHYPGYPSSVERAIATLGGTEGIIKARCSLSNNLELRFRPEDPYSHPAFGELLPCNNFLLKIWKHSNKQSQTADGSSPANRDSPQLMEDADGVGRPETELVTHPTEAEAQTSEGSNNVFANIVGQVSEAYYFNGMVDYQHVLAVHADAARKRKRNWADIEPQFEKHGLIDVDQEDLMILLPPLFSLKDMPQNVVLKPSMGLSMKKKQELAVRQRWEMEIEPSLAIDFGIKEIPKKVCWEKFIPEGSNEWKCQVAVCELFDQRPIWIKESISEHLFKKGLKIASNFLKRLLFRAAYYFGNGPFLRFWIRKGYDPRKDPESRIYQRIDFRVPPSLRSYCDTAVTSGLKHRWEDLCAFRVFPYKCQTSLQLFELEDDYIHQEIRKPSTQTTCTLATGWFSSHILDNLRSCVAVRFLSKYPNPGAESILKSASIRFEKSKRSSIIMKEQKLNEKGQQINKEQILVDEKEMSNDEDDDGGEDENVEDDMEDENIEDEYEAYDALDLADDEINFSPGASYTNQENISKNYLQDLFGSFPSHEGGLEFQDAENSDGEYQIYDQFSDGNDSDEDY